MPGGVLYETRSEAQEYADEAAGVVIEMPGGKFAVVPTGIDLDDYFGYLPLDDAGELNEGVSPIDPMMPAEPPIPAAGGEPSQPAVGAEPSQPAARMREALQGMARQRPQSRRPGFHSYPPGLPQGLRRPAGV
tara:strand:- start:5494 stop:5892 length:399 start_codon:yes stop_codon:yes gene_type:complete